MNNYNIPDEENEEDEKETEPTPPESRIVFESFSEEVEEDNSDARED